MPEPKPPISQLEFKGRDPGLPDEIEAVDYGPVEPSVPPVRPPLPIRADAEQLAELFQPLVEAAGKMATVLAAEAPRIVAAFARLAEQLTVVNTNLVALRQGQIDAMRGRH